MEKQKVQVKVQKVINKISSNRYLQAIMSGMMMMMPATIIGSLATLLKTINIEAYQNFLVSTKLDSLLNVAVTCTTNIISLIVVFSIAMAVAESFQMKGISPAILALVSFFILTPMETTVNEYGMSNTNIPMTYLGSAGMFTAIIVAIVVARLYVLIVKKGITIKMPDSVPPFIQELFAALTPGALISILMIIIRALFNMTSYGSVHGAIYGILQTPLQNMSGTIVTLIIVILLTKLLWFFGIHGAMVTGAVMSPVWMALDMANMSAVAAGQPLPNMIGNAFYSTVTIGGGTIAFAICLMFAKSKRYKALGKVAIVPALFNISEPMMFGAPLVLNFNLAIPFIFSPIITTVIGYLFTISGIIPVLPGVSAPAGTPFVASGFIVGGWRYAIFQIVMILLLIPFWWIFFKVEDKKAYTLENASEVAAEQK